MEKETILQRIKRIVLEEMGFTVVLIAAVLLFGGLYYLAINSGIPFNAVGKMIELVLFGSFASFLFLISIPARMDAIIEKPVILIFALPAVMLLILPFFYYMIRQHRYRIVMLLAYLLPFILITIFVGLVALSP